jgi:hypothetical protein
MVVGLGGGEGEREGEGERGGDEPVVLHAATHQAMLRTCDQVAGAGEGERVKQVQIAALGGIDAVVAAMRGHPHLALTVLCVPYSLDHGGGRFERRVGKVTLAIL